METKQTNKQTNTLNKKNNGFSCRPKQVLFFAPKKKDEATKRSVHLRAVDNIPTLLGEENENPDDAVSTGGGGAVQGG